MPQQPGRATAQQQCHIGTGKLQLSCRQVAGRSLGICRPFPCSCMLPKHCERKERGNGHCGSGNVLRLQVCDKGLLVAHGQGSAPPSWTWMQREKCTFGRGGGGDWPTRPNDIIPDYECHRERPPAAPPLAVQPGTPGWPCPGRRSPATSARPALGTGRTPGQGRRSARSRHASDSRRHAHTQAP